MAGRQGTEACAALVACGMFALLHATAVLAQTSTTTEFGAWLGHESNAPRAPAGGPSASENTQGVSLSAAQTRMLDDRSGLRLKGSAILENHERFRALDNGSLRFDAAYRRQPSRGYVNPWYEVAAFVQQVKFADSRMRDGTLAGVAGAAGKNLTDRISGRAGAGYDWRRPAVSNVFDTHARKLFGELAYRTPGGHLFYVRGTRTWGDQVFSSFESGSYSGYIAGEDDTAFGEDYYAYRVQAVSRVIDLGAVVALERGNSIVLNASRYAARADTGEKYDNVVVRAAWFHRFQ